MKIAVTAQFQKDFDHLPVYLKKKTKKAISFLKNNFRYPSLKTKKMGGSKNIWEARVDRSYRFTFGIEQDTYFLYRVGPHDEGLGKK